MTNIPTTAGAAVDDGTGFNVLSVPLAGVSLVSGVGGNEILAKNNNFFFFWINQLFLINKYILFFCKRKINLRMEEELEHQLDN